MLFKKEKEVDKMVDFSIGQKLSQLKDILISSPFLFISLIFAVVLLVIMLIGIKRNRRINKIVFITSWVFVIVFITFRYSTYLIDIFDRLVERFVEEIYFPSISVYTIMLLITNIIFLYSVFSKKLSKLVRSVNIVLSVEIDFLFLLILDTISKHNIDVYDKLIAYTNSGLLVLLELSMIIFVGWLIFLCIMFIIHKYAVRKIYVNLYKEEDYEILNMDSDETEDIVDIEDSSGEILALDIDNTEIVDI